MYPAKPSDVELRATIGGPLVKKPYSAAMLNISAMSYGALSDNAILALSRCVGECCAGMRWARDLPGE